MIHCMQHTNTAMKKLRNFLKEHATATALVAVLVLASALRVWNYDFDANKQGHITPKPIPLLKNIIEHCTDPGDTVLDCFGGSGSTAVAAIESNRQYILIEKEEKYHAIAQDRVTVAELAQQRADSLLACV